MLILDIYKIKVVKMNKSSGNSQNMRNVFAKILKNIRLQLGLTQTQFADLMMGMNQKTVSRIENGKTKDIPISVIFFILQENISKNITFNDQFDYVIDNLTDKEIGNIIQQNKTDNESHNSNYFQEIQEKDLQIKQLKEQIQDLKNDKLLMKQFIETLQKQ